MLILKVYSYKKVPHSPRKNLLKKRGMGMGDWPGSPGKLETTSLASSNLSTNFKVNSTCYFNGKFLLFLNCLIVLFTIHSAVLAGHFFHFTRRSHELSLLSEFDLEICTFCATINTNRFQYFIYFCFDEFE